MTNEDFVSRKTALRLKKLGFHFLCYSYYTKEDAPEGYVWITTSTITPEDWNIDRENEPAFLKPVCSAPTLAQAHKWLREVKGIAINIIAHDGGLYQWEDVILPNAPGYKHFIYSDIKQYDTYESALSAGIEATLIVIEEGEV